MLLDPYLPNIFLKSLHYGLYNALRSFVSSKGSHCLLLCEAVLQRLDKINEADSGEKCFCQTKYVINKFSDKVIHIQSSGQLYPNRLIYFQSNQLVLLSIPGRRSAAIDG